LTLVFVLALVGTAAAKPPTDPPVEPVVTIETLQLTCPDGGHLSAAVTVSAGDQTSLDEIHVVIHELKFVEAGTGGYFPYDTILPVAQWGDGISARQERGKPGQGLPNPTTFILRTGDGPDHYWNTVLGGETPAADSWFEVNAHGHGSSTNRSGDWAADDRTDFINCGTGQVMTNATNPWNDWNYPEEG
jgi:hypothetical protein